MQIVTAVANRTLIAMTEFSVRMVDDAKVRTTKHGVVANKLNTTCTRIITVNWTSCRRRTIGTSRWDSYWTL